jgi:pSer/pThr/pTyr-binding forkhead associated (FHA) protein
MIKNPQIKVLSTELRGKIFPLENDEYLVGRGEESDVCIPNEAISSRHCQLKKNESGDYTITDLDSTNGTTINGKTIESAELTHGDIIKLGGIEVLYESPNKPQSAGESHKSQVGIDLKSTAGTSTVSEAPNFSPFGSGSGHNRSESSTVSKVLGIGLAGLSVILIVILLILLIRNL